MVAVLDKINIQQARENEELLNDFVEQNKGLIYREAYRFSTARVEFDDLIAIGYYGLLKAFRTFNLESGNQFSTYAKTVISNEMGMEVRKNYYRKKALVSSLDFAVSEDKDGDELVLMDILSSPEDDFKLEDYEALKDVIDVFQLRFQKEPRLIKALQMYVVENKTSSEIAKVFGVGQPQGSRIAIRAVKEFQKIAIEMEVIDTFNTYFKRAKNNRRVEKLEKRDKVKARALYIINNYPDLKPKEIAEILGCEMQLVGRMIGRTKFPFKPDDSIKPAVETYIRRKGMI